MTQMKAAAVSLWFLHRDFDQTAGGEATPRPGVGGVLARNVNVVLQDLFSNVRSYLVTPSAHPGQDDPTAKIYYNRALVAFSTLSVLNEKLLFKQNLANGGMGRANEYLRGARQLRARVAAHAHTALRAALMVGLDQLRAIRKYHSSPVRMQRCGACSSSRVYVTTHAPASQLLRADGAPHARVSGALLAALLPRVRQEQRRVRRTQVA